MIYHARSRRSTGSGSVRPESISNRRCRLLRWYCHSIPASLAAFAAFLCAGIGQAQTPPVLNDVSVVREDPLLVRCFFNGHSDDGSVTGVLVQPLDELGEPQGSPFRVDVSQDLSGVTDFSGWSNVAVVPWKDGAQAEITLCDKAGQTSDSMVAAVPRYRVGGTPGVTMWNVVRKGADGVALSLSAVDPENDTAEFRVTLLDASGNTVAKRWYDARTALPSFESVADVSLSQVGGALSGTVTAIDMDGNASASYCFPIPPAATTDVPQVRQLSVTRPHPKTLHVHFMFHDDGKNPASATVEFLNASLSALTTPFAISYQGIDGSGGNPDLYSGDYMGDADAALDSQAAFVRVTARDSLGNTSSTAMVSVPPVFVPGDVNNDGRVSLWDAVLAMRVMLGTSPVRPSLLARADVTPGEGDGVVSMKDVAAILKYASGMYKRWPLPW